MRKLTIFNFISLNGYYKGINEDISWHRHGPEENQYAVESLKSGNILLFGRVTFELMAGYWTNAQAIQNDPVVADGMNRAEKIVFSRSLKNAGWNNAKVLRHNIVEEIKKMKTLPGKDMAVLGSGSIVTLFADAGLIDEYQVMVDPVVLKDGTPLFKNIGHALNLQLTGTQSFKSGVVLLSYRPADK